MERSKSQTHDFMNLESFSRLSFSPHFPPKENSIRLFGKEIGSADLATLIHKETKENAENRRKYECNYCCRNFSTSQALGGHQNAHRKERLLAKRPLLQSLAIHRSSSKTQLHSFVNHHHHSLKTTSSQPCHQQSATHTVSSNSNYVRGYGWKTSYTSHKTPINGRPLALWRFPTAVLNSTSFKHGGLWSSSNTGSSSRNLYVHESQPNIRDQVSLDLHL